MICVLPQSKYTRFILKYINGKRTVGEIIERVKKECTDFDMREPPRREAIFHEYLTIFNVFRVCSESQHVAI